MPRLLLSTLHEPGYSAFLNYMAKMAEAAQQWEKFRRVILPAFGIKWYEPADSAFSQLLAIAEDYFQLKAKENK